MNMPVADEDGVRNDVRLREQRCEQRGCRPVRGGTPSVEQTRCAEQEGAGADAGDAPGPRRAISNPRDEIGFCRHRSASRLRSSRNDDGIEIVIQFTDLAWYRIFAGPSWI